MSFASIRSRGAELRWTAVLLVLFAAVVVPFFLLEAALAPSIERLQNSVDGTVSLFALVTLVLASDVFLPVPSSVVSTWAGAELGFVYGTLAAWLGMSLGCLLAYELARRFGLKALRRFVGEKQYRKAEAFNAHYGLVTLALLRAVPVLAEASVFWAGLAGVTRLRFMLVVLSANLGIATTYAAVGAYAVHWNVFLAAFGFAMMFPGLAMLAARKALRETVQATADTAVEQARIRLEHSYPVVFTRNVFSPDNTALLDALGPAPGAQRVAVCVDDGVLGTWPKLTRKIHGYAQRYDQRLTLAGSVFSVPGGEICKSDPEVLVRLYGHLQRNGVDRHSYVLAIGGGAVLDAVGYAAATAHRGIRLIRLPTTVLAQNDAGIGVKNGINLDGQKNYLGTFAPPFAVINDSCFLQTLNPRDRRAGMAEAVKVALIRDAGFFQWMERHTDELSSSDPKALQVLIKRCVQLHLHQITTGGDPFESGSSRPLDFGHWAAHRLESLSNYALRHGEAVAIGVALDTRYSVLAGYLIPGVELRVCSLLETLGFRLWHPAMALRDSGGGHALLQGLRQFQEHLGGELTISLLSDIGRECTVHNMDEGKILNAANWLQQRLTRE